MDNAKCIQYVFVLLLLTKINGQDSASDQPDLTTYYNRYRSYLTCVAGTNALNSALTFITPLSASMQPAAFKYSNPDNSGSSFDCDFEGSDACIKSWMTNGLTLTSSGFHNTAPVTDERWNKFKFQETVGEKYPNYGTNYKISEKNFHISISVRSTRDAQILLCDESYYATPRSAPCYWIMIGAKIDRKNVTALRKCENGVPDDYPRNDKQCQNLRAVKEYNYQKLNQNEWLHYTLKRENDKTLYLWLANDEELIFQYTDTTPLQINSMRFRGYNDAKAEWRVHEYQYLTVTSPDRPIILSQAITVTETGPACISLYVLLCSTCQLAFGLDNDSGTVLNEIVKGKAEQMLTWQNVRLEVLVHKHQIYTLHITGSITGDTFEPVWAIDDIRQCHANETRIGSIVVDQNTKKTINCESLQYPEWTFVQAQRKNINDVTECFGRYTGPYCNITCQSVGLNEYCDKNTICRPTRWDSRDYSCTCSSGYSGEYCDSACPYGTFGSNCKKECGHCKHGNTYCHISTGVCQYGCEEEYLEPECKLTKYPYLLTPPKVVDVFYTNVTVEIVNVTVAGGGEAATYQIQYKTEDSHWKTFGEKQNFQLHSKVTITNLQKDTPYKIRAILYTSDEKYFDKEDINTTSVRTTCNETLPIHIKSSIKDARLLIVANEETCDTKNYYAILNLNNMEIDRFRITNNKPIIRLRPYTRYELIILSEVYKNYKHVESFRTLEDAPSEVVNLRTVRKSPTSIFITWDNPLQLNGEIRKYTIFYKLIGHIDCSAGLKSDELQKIVSPYEDKSSIEIDKLFPYANYEVSVMASTLYDGPKNKQIFQTAATEQVEDEELPTKLETDKSSTYATLRWTAPACDKRKGPLLYTITHTCIEDDWCSKEDTSDNVNGVVGFLRLDFLIPFTHYKVTLRASREERSPLAKTERITEFITDVGVPPPVRDLVAYSRTETTVSIRWKKPYPPHGQLEKYELAKCYYSSRPCSTSYYESITTRTCELWENYTCYELRDLYKKYKYIILIKAKNRNVYTLSNEIKIDTITSEAPSAMPLNLTSNWNRDKLILNWNHPDKTNGPLTDFLITFQQIDTDITDNKGGKVYSYLFPIKPKKSYQYEIEKSIQYSSSYEIKVCGLNKYIGENITINIQTPPEKPQLTSDITYTEVSNTTIVINIPGIRADTRSRKSYIYVIVGELESNSHVKKRAADENADDLKSRLLNLTPNPGRSWIVGELNPSESATTFTIGDESMKYSEQLNVTIENRALKPLHTYDVNVIVTNIYREQSSYQTYQLASVQTEATYVPSNFGGLFALLLLLLLPVVGYFLYKRYGKKSNISTSRISLAGLNNIAAETQYEPDVIPLTVPSNEPELKPKRPTVAPKPAQTSKLADENTVPLIQNPASTGGTANFHSRLVPLNNLEEYIKEALENGELAQQHALFPRGQTKPWDYGLLKPNKFKNRYNNLIAYDQNRVKLQKINNDQYSDYINASYVHGYKQTKAYIATQGPKLSTLNDFWRMIWQEKVRYVIMLANVVEGGKKKCEQYWPDVDSSKEFGNIIITFSRSEVFADYEYRVFDVTYAGESRKVDQLHFTSWPDHGVPLYPQSLVPFLRKMLTIPQSNAPIVVHCSAGVGRTGTIILCDICLRMAARESAVDVLRYLHELREQRANMVDNLDQYKLVHMVLMECLLAPNTTIPCNTDISAAVEKLINEGGLPLQLDYLQQTAWQDQALNFTAQKEPNSVNDSKNRFKNIVPVVNRIYISRYPADDENADYINAVPVDGFRFKEQFIVTQNPLPNTVKDFWRMILEKEVKVIVSINNIPLDDKTCCIFWPKEQEEIRPFPNLLVTYHKTQVNDHYDTYSLIIQETNTKDKEKSIVQLVQFKHWNHKDKVPDNPEHLIMLWEETEILTRGNSPMVVTCHDGATASGLFVALSFVIEKIKLEQQCDVCLAVRVIRRNRKQFVTEKVQFEFLYRAAVVYLSLFETYANFQPVLKK